MTLRQIDNMNVVAHTGAVRRGIVVAEHVQMVALADGGLRNIRHKIIGNAVRMLADFSAFVRTDRVEIAQVHDRPFGVRFCDVAQDLFPHVLCPAVGIGAVSGFGGLAQRHLVVAGIDRGGRGKDDVLDVVLCHDLAEHQGGIEIVLIIFHRLGNGLADGLEARKVDGAGNLMLCKDFFQQRLVAHIALDELHRLAGNFGYAVQAFRVGIAEIVNYNRRMACFDQFHTGMAANISGAAGHKYVHLDSSSTIFRISSHFFSMSATSLNWVRQRSRFCPSR